MTPYEISKLSELSLALRKEIMANIRFGRTIYATAQDIEDVIWQTIGPAFEAAEAMADGRDYTAARNAFRIAAADIIASQAPDGQTTRPEPTK